MPTKNSPAKIAYNNKWTNARFDRINIAVKKGEKEKYRDAAAAVGLSLNAWIVAAMEEKRGK
jgi:predicted HicB family RNase H-like nuclease